MQFYLLHHIIPTSGLLGLYLFCGSSKNYRELTFLRQNVPHLSESSCALSTIANDHAFIISALAPVLPRSWEPVRRLKGASH